MARKTLAEAAAEMFGSNLSSKVAARDGRGKDTGTKIVSPNDSDQKLPGPTPEDNSYSELKAAEHLTKEATPPGATPPVGNEPIKDIHVGEPGKDRAKAHDDGTVTEEPIDEEDLAEEEDEKEDMKESVADRVKSYLKDNGSVNMEEDMKALFSGEQLSETFMAKAKVIFETAVIEKATKVCEQIEESFVQELDEAINEIQSQLVESVDDYLSYMVEEWVKENEVAIEKGLRTELAEEFMTSLKNVFLEHYIDIPDDKVNVVEELATKVGELEGKVNEEIERGVALNKTVIEYKKKEVLRTVCEGLTETQLQKMLDLSEKVAFSSPEEFKRAATTLKESYFPGPKTETKKQQLDEESVQGDEKGVTEVEIPDPEIALYVRTISKSKNNGM